MESGTTILKEITLGLYLHPRLHFAKSFDAGLGPPIGDIDPSTEVVGVLRGYRLLRWRGLGRRLKDKQLFLHKVKDKYQRMKTNFTRFSEIVKHTSVRWDADINTVTTNPDVWDMFIKGKQKQHVDLEEGFDESDDPAHVEQPILTESRRRVPKRSQSKSSQMPECMDIFRESFTKNLQDTPPSAKKSKSVSSPEKPEKNSIEETLNELAKLESRIPQSLFVKAGKALLDPSSRRLFMWFKEESRMEWILQRDHL
ncbi:hypothetical protein CRG98_024350 [Punica granatum]|uniref:Myb/SANT-like domain-containing protein n=1 Tax=Punica granatum TaxID=22663 RepID=A0A2I0JGG4_PUNGR|nr:hypothetical protein CRG98_024350 [Punica granatum]